MKTNLDNCDPAYFSPPYDAAAFSASMIAAVTCASIAIILSLVSFLLWRKYFQAAYYYLDDPPSARGVSPALFETFDESESAAIPVPMFAKHVQVRH